MSADPPPDRPADEPAQGPATGPADDQFEDAVTSTAETLAPPTGERHDPTGSDLARAVARAYRGATGTPRLRRRSGRGRSGTWSSPQVSGAGPDERDPQAVGRAMSRLVAEHGWSTDLAVHGVFGRWETIVGAEVAAHCRPERFVDGRLTARADSTAWATQMRLLAPMVTQRLNDELGDGTVTRIDVTGPQPPSWRHGRFSVRDARGPRDTYG